MLAMADTRELRPSIRKAERRVVNAVMTWLMECTLANERRLEWSAMALWHVRRRVRVARKGKR